MLKFPQVFYQILKNKFRDPLFLLALILLIYWGMDAWYKIFVQHAPTRMFWYSSMGLGVTSIGLFARSPLILSAMFSVLLFQEGIWNLSFFSNLFSLPDYLQTASYAFGKKFPTIGLIITLFHLLLLPSILFGLYQLKKVSRWGWLLGYIFALAINYLPLIFPDKEDVNCVRGQIASCQIFFGAFYTINPVTGIFGGVTYQLFLIYIPANVLLINIFDKGKYFVKFISSPILFLKKLFFSHRFYLSSLIFLLTLFWIADTFEKVSTQHAISRIFWWSSSGLLLVIIGLYKRSPLLLTGMFCALFLIESTWSISFLTYLLTGYSLPYLSFALYGFGVNYPISSFIITLFHLLLVPSLIFGLLVTKKISRYGWILALIFHIITMTLAHFFPDTTENINCSKEVNILCTYIYGLSDQRGFWPNLIFSTLYQTVLLYIPLNLGLLFLSKRFISKAVKTV